MVNSHRRLCHWKFHRISQISSLHKSIAGRYRPVRVADGPITARCRFMKNASWVCTFVSFLLIHICLLFLHSIWTPGQAILPWIWRWLMSSSTKRSGRLLGPGRPCTKAIACLRQLVIMTSISFSKRGFMWCIASRTKRTLWCYMPITNTRMDQFANPCSLKAFSVCWYS